MKIADLEFYLVEVPGPVALSARSLLMRLATDSGQEGWGETTPLWRPAELAARREALLPLLAGRSVFDVEELSLLDGPAPLRSALDMACWDLIGRAAGLPLCRLWGGEFRQRVPVAVRLPPASPAATAALARELAEQGFHLQTLTAGGRLEDDLQRLAAVREATRERVAWRFDGGSRYDPQAARDLCGKLADDAVEFFLDPLRDRDIEALAALEGQTRVPLAVSIGAGGTADMLRLSWHQIAAHTVVDPCRVGGLTQARKCAAVAEAAERPMSLATIGRLGIAAAALVQLAAATPNLISGHECACRPLADGVLSEPLVAIDGMLSVPQGPGLGVEVDRAKVEAYQVD